MLPIGLFLTSLTTTILPYPGEVSGETGGGFFLAIFCAYSYPALVHKPSFLKQVFYSPSFHYRHTTDMKQYNNHWTDPTQTTIIWVGMLFAIMCYSVQSYRRNKQEPPEYHGTSAAIMELYRIRAAQCIGIADITKPVPAMLQTFYLYAMVEYGDERDGDMGTYLLSGTLVRLALQQGYHRDPSQHPNISVFEAEMRRRLWNAVVQHDLLACVRIGLPKSLRYSESDTEEPRNLYEEELYEDMRELPPSRPLGEPTPMSYVITKARIMKCYGRVVEFLHQLVPQPYEEVLKLDTALMEARELIPSHLQLRPLEEMQGDAPSLILERYIIQLFYHKAVCLLHRKYWKSSPTDSDRSFFYSRKASIASAMTLLSHQATMHRACRPGGPLTNMKWYHFAITNHDFLLAAMIICLDLMSIERARREPEPPNYDCIVPDIDKLNAIQRSRAIWSEVIDDCKDAKRAGNILTGVLGKLSMKAEEMKNSTPETPISASATNPTADSLRFSPYFTDQFGLGIPLVADPPNGADTVMHDNVPSSEGILDKLGSDWQTLPADFDWVGSSSLLFSEKRSLTISTGRLGSIRGNAVSTSASTSRSRFAKCLFPITTLGKRRSSCILLFTYN